jgi:diguanylate cyclase (GGDEF)-like protein
MAICAARSHVEAPPDCVAGCAVVNDKTHRAGDEDDPAETVNAGEHRDRTAEARDERADAHDDASEARDKRADARDKRADARDRAAADADTGAAADRAGALRDRRGGASDRTQAADDREAASADRVLAARERAISSIDELTGAHCRDAGLVELTRDLARAKRAKQPFALAFIDVDDLKGKNDSLGHPAGDKLLRETVDSIRAHLRTYDLLIRFGGDEFLCGLMGVTMAEAAKRFSLVNADLAAKKASVTVGLTELKGDDGVEELIGRADAAMYEARQRVRSKRPAAAKRRGKQAPATTGT